MVNSQAKGRNANVKIKAVVILKKKAHQGRELWFNRWVMSLHVCMIYQASAKTVRRDYMQQVIQGVQQRTQPFVKDPQQHSAYPASRGYIFAVWAVVQKVASADNRSIFYHACVKFVTWFASKINLQVCCQMAWVSREQKNCDSSDLLHKTYVRLT